MRLYDALGRQVRTVLNEEQAGRRERTLDVGSTVQRCLLTAAERRWTDPDPALDSGAVSSRVRRSLSNIPRSP